MGRDLGPWSAKDIVATAAAGPLRQGCFAVHSSRVFDTDPDFPECLAWLLELRLRVRGDRESLAIVDRCIAICGKATSADPADMARLNAQLSEIADTLALQFGAPKNAALQ